MRETECIPNLCMLENNLKLKNLLTVVNINVLNTLLTVSHIDIE